MGTNDTRALAVSQVLSLDRGQRIIVARAARLMKKAGLKWADDSAIRFAIGGDTRCLSGLSLEPGGFLLGLRKRG